MSTLRQEDLKGIEILRRLVKRFNGCNEDFNLRYTVDQLIRIDDAWSRCGWDIYPDQWTARQIDEALHGIVPTWDTDERPMYSTSAPTP